MSHCKGCSGPEIPTHPVSSLFLTLNKWRGGCNSGRILVAKVANVAEDAQKAKEKAAWKAAEATEAEAAEKAATLAKERKDTAKAAVHGKGKGKGKFTDSATTSSTEDKGKKTGLKSESRGKTTPHGVVFPWRMGVLAGAMWGTTLTKLSWKELEKQVPKPVIHEKGKLSASGPV